MAKAFDLKLREALRILPSLVKDRMQRVGVEMEAYIDDNFGSRGLETTGDRASAGRKRNETDQLRIVSGRLLKAFVKGRKGYASRFENSPTDGPSWVVDVDLKAVPYARIQELGGTINHPGGSPYVIGADGKARFVKKGSKAAAKAAGITKPHTITIKPRPYIKPAIEGYQRDVMQNLADGIMERLFA